MKRLKKKAWESITLYHHTSSQIFMQMMNDGQITPGGYTNSISGGGHEPYYVLPNESNNPDIEYITLHELDSFKGRNVGVSPQLTKFVEEIKGDYPDSWEGVEIEVAIVYPSNNENGVYLTDDHYDRSSYAKQAVMNGDNSLLNFGVSLKIKVQTDALSPDYDDLGFYEKEVNKDSSTPLWKQSLDKIGQCVHNGPIDVSAIESVTFTDIKEPSGGTPKFENEDDFYEFHHEYLCAHEPFTAQQAFDGLNSLIENYNNLELENRKLVNSRLKK